MDIQSFFTILNILASFYGFILFFIHRSLSRVNFVFSIFSLSIFIWALFFLFNRNAPNPEISKNLMHVSIGSAIFIPVLFLHFIKELINDNKYQRILNLIYVYSVLLFIASFICHNDFIIKAVYIQNYKFFPQPGILYGFFAFSYFIFSAYALYILWLHIKRYNSNKLKPVFWGNLLAYFGGSSNILISYFHNIAPIGNFAISFYILFITYAILKYQLFNIKLILRKGLIYTILITAITVSYIILTVITEKVFKEYFGYSSILISLLVATLVSLLFIPVKEFIENLIFKESFVKTYEKNQILLKEIQQTDKLRTIATLASGMAHEIKNPLTPIRTFAEQLPHRINDKEFLLKFSDIIIKEVDRIDSLVHELLDFAKPSPPNLSKTNITQLINSTLDFLNNEIIKHHIIVCREYIISPETQIHIDPKQIKQALLNIILNAIEAMKHGGQLSVYLDINDHYLVVRIQDTGIGIDPKDLPYIFDPFYSKKDNGTGLGLSITHEIINNHGGTITAQSELNQGTSFTIKLPID